VHTDSEYATLLTGILTFVLLKCQGTVWQGESSSFMCVCGCSLCHFEAAIG